MDKTTADLLTQVEQELAGQWVRHESVESLIAELRRVTEPVTDAEVAISLRSARVSSSSHVQKLAAVIERLARENAEMQKRLSGTLGKNTVYPGEPHEELWVKIR